MRATAALALLLLTGCQAAWWPPTGARAWTPAGAPTLRVAVARPVEPSGADAAPTELQIAPAYLVGSMPLFWGALPVSMAIAVAPALPQTLIQHDPVGRAIPLLRFDDPAVAARDAFVQAWNAAGRQPRAVALDVPPVVVDTQFGPRIDGEGPLLVLGNVRLALRDDRLQGTGGFERIPDAPPEYELRASIAVALFTDDAVAPFYCQRGDEPYRRPQPLPREWDFGDGPQRATMAQWTSGGGRRLAAALSELGRARGLALARVLGELQDAATLPLESAPPR